MTSQEKKLEKRIMDIIEAEGGATDELIAKLRSKYPSVSESLARHMVWRLVDRGQLEFTQDRKFAILHKHLLEPT